MENHIRDIWGIFIEERTKVSLQTNSKILDVKEPIPFTLEFRENEK